MTGNYNLFQPNQNIETHYHSNFHTLAVDKNIFFTFLFKHHCFGCKMAVLRYGYLSQCVLEFPL